MKAIRVEPTTMTKASYFTIAEVINAIVDLERVDRPQSEWCGGVNCNHIYFEGLLVSYLAAINGRTLSSTLSTEIYNNCHRLVIFNNLSKITNSK